MAALELGQSPPLALPGRFLATAPLWGIVACVLMALLGPAPWASRWHPGLLALVHLTLLGVIGNACIGALLQFLSAAAGSRPAGAAAFWNGQHALYNLGVFALSLGLLRMDHSLLGLAAVLLVAAILAAVGAMLIGLTAGFAERFLRASLALPLLAWCVTALLGAVLVAILRGHLALNLVAVTDAHALIGVGGVFGLLLVAVSRVVLPMLLGMTPWRALTFARTFIVLVMLLMTAVCWRLLTDAAAAPLRIAAAALLALTAVALVALFGRSRGRNRPLAFAWVLGLATAHAAAWPLLIAPQRAGLVPMVALVGCALPLLVLSTLLEISAFIGWIDLHLRSGRAVPGVHQLMPDGAKWRWLALQCIAATMLLLLALHPTPVSAWLAAAAGVSAYTALALVRAQPGWRARRFEQCRP